MSPLMRWEKSEQMKTNKKVLKNRTRLFKPGDFTKKTLGNSTSSEYVTSRRALSPFTPSLISFWRFCTLFTCTFLGKCSPYWSIFVNKMGPLWADVNSSTSGRSDMWSSARQKCSFTVPSGGPKRERKVQWGVLELFDLPGLEKTKRMSNARVPTSKYSWFLSPSIPQKQSCCHFTSTSQAKNLFQQFTPPNLCKTASSLLSEVGRIVLSHENNRLRRSPGPKGYLKDHPRTCKYFEAIKRPLGRGISPSLGDLLTMVIKHFLNGMILQVKSHRLMEILHSSGGGACSTIFHPVFLASNRHVVFFSWVFDPLSAFRLTDF